MEKLIESHTSISADSFTYLKQEDLRPNVRGVLELAKTGEPFPRRILMDMSLIEIVSFWQAVSIHPLSPFVEARWLNLHVGMIIPIFYLLKRVERATKGIMPLGWEQLSLSELIVHGGRLNEACITPSLTTGYQHTLTGINLRVMISTSSVDSGAIWHERIV
jgi:hypothetical protein